jgi:hypothetical protein
MPDKVNAPGTETDGEGSVSNEGQEASGQAAAPEVTALQQALENERKTRIETERSYQSLRSKYNERDQEIATLRASVARANAGQGEGDGQVGPATVDPELAGEVVATREEVAWLRFQQSHPDYADLWDEMQELAKNPVTRATIESHRIVGGRPVLNTFATLHNAYNEAKVRRISKAQSDAGMRKAESATTTQKIRAQATISGSGAASEEGGAADHGIPYDELINMEYDDIIKDPRYRKNINPNDPPRGSGR